MFNVDDIATAVDYFKSRGVKIEDHIEDTPGCLMAFAEDSEGNHFILHQRKGGRDRRAYSGSLNATNCFSQR